MIVEVCANSFESAINAEKAGADRIELCMELGVGGVTPSYGLIKQVVSELSIPVHVLVRPRSGDFTYSKEEFQIMQDDILVCLDLGVSGIVSGVLNRDLSLDLERTALLVDKTSSKHFTFHRAFDWIKEPLTAIPELEKIGVDAILSSGQEISAYLAMDKLKTWQETSGGCIIMPGGGINNSNAFAFKKNGFKAIHLSGVKFKKTLDSNPRISMNSAKYLADDSVAVSDYQTLKDVINTLNKI
ncbi:MAG: copper homeostasis protein CutC [Eudoraea sp.]